MPLSWNEIKSRSLAFSKHWEHDSSEDAEAKSFWDEFFNVFGISRRRVASFEEPVKKLGNKQGFIDLFWKGVMIVEHKSRGKDLDKAYTQAIDYFAGIKERDLPKYVLVSDFAGFRLYNLEDKTTHEFPLKDLHKNIKLFGFIAGYQTHKIKDQDPVNIKAAEKMGKLHDQMREVGYEGHALELYLVRLLFCLFAEDTGIFERQQFQEYLDDRTSEDGSDLAHHLTTLFQTLNTPREKRYKNLDEHLAAFHYINGKLFEEMLPTASFDKAMRQALLDCCALDWSRISPAIFGSLFQSIMDKKARRNLGAHYTSEKNILKLIKPLFLDGLWAEFDKIKHQKNKLFEFHQRLRELTFLDPACGCGNFLVIAYRELRLLELEVLRIRHRYNSESGQFESVETMVLINVDQFYGIEIEEFPAQIAQVALWLMDHQMNLQVSEEFGMYFARIPLRATSTIVCANALRLDWNDVVPAEKLSFIMGNPPFIGAKFLNEEQKQDVQAVFEGVKSAGILDFVAAWYVKAAGMIQESNIRCAFVSTNSICQGEQVSILWGYMLANNMKIFFAHRTFAWNNEARGKAAVHCVIVGFSRHEPIHKLIFEYDSLKGDPHLLLAKNINPYLIDGPDVIAEGRMSPICNVPAIVNGSIPADGGNLILEPHEKNIFVEKEPSSALWIKPYLGAEGFIHNEYRYCLWLVDCPPSELRKMPLILDRVNKVKIMRLASSKLATKEKSNIASLFTENRQPRKGHYLAIPRTSSENRRYLPIGVLSSDIIAANDLQIIPNADLFSFGIITSLMHKSWASVTAGRLKSDLRYSVKYTYNTFPWPENPTEKQTQTIEAAAQAVLDARLQFPDSSLADLYDPLTMPPVLLKAHQTLDKAVDAAYGKTNFKTEAERVAFLFEVYQKYTSLLPAEKPKKPRKKSAE